MNSRFPPYPEQDGKDATPRPGPGAAGHGYTGYRAAPPPFAEAYWETPEQDEGRGWRIALVMIAVFVVGAAVGLATAWWLGVSWPDSSAPVGELAVESSTMPRAPEPGAVANSPSAGLPAAELPFDGGDAEESAVAVAREPSDSVDTRSDSSSGASARPEATRGAGPGESPVARVGGGGAGGADVERRAARSAAAAPQTIRDGVTAASAKPSDPPDTNANPGKLGANASASEGSASEASPRKTDKSASRAEVDTGKAEVHAGKADEVDSKVETNAAKAATAAADRRPAGNAQPSRKRPDQVAASARAKPERTRSRSGTESVRSSGGLSGGPAMAGAPPAESELARMRRQAAEEQSKGMRERLYEQPAAPASAAPPGALTPTQPLPAG